MLRNQSPVPLMGLTAVLLICSTLPGDETTQSDGSAASEKIGAALVAAYNAHDAKALAALFTPEGEFVDGAGNEFQGPGRIQAEFAALFKIYPQGRLAAQTRSRRTLAPGIVLEEGVATVWTDQKAAGSDVDYLLIRVKQADGSWQIASLRSKGDDFVTPHEHLESLRWLVGDWIDESPDALVETSVRWSEDGAFLLSDFVIQAAGSRRRGGSQRIGWDASTSRFKSWIFNADGGHATGEWTQAGNRWIVKLSGVQPNGTHVSATNIYTVLGPDRFQWQAVDRVIGGDQAPDLRAMIVRKAPEAGKKK